MRRAHARRRAPQLLELALRRGHARRERGGEARREQAEALIPRRRPPRGPAAVGGVARVQVHGREGGGERGALRLAEQRALRLRLVRRAAEHRARDGAQRGLRPVRHGDGHEGLRHESVPRRERRKRRVAVRGRHRQHAEPLAQQPTHLARERGGTAAEGGRRQRARALGRPQERELLRLVEPAARVVAAEQRAEQAELCGG